MNNTNLNVLCDADHIVYGVGYAVKDDEPLEYCLATVRSSINNIKDRFPDGTNHQFFIGGKNNFRDKIGTHQIYKGNRDPSQRPKFYDEIRQYMIEHHDAVVVNGMEAEDAVGIRQWANKDKSTVIVGVDKDLDCIPGFHYNPKKDILSYISLPDANENFWRQVLMGDRTDNIRGIDGLGPVKANKLLAPCNKGWLEMEAVAREQYARQHREQGNSILHETAVLIWILREENKTYDGSSITT